MPRTPKSTPSLAIILLVFLALLSTSGCVDKGAPSGGAENNITPEISQLPPPQPPLPHVSRWEVELTGEDREEAINLVLNDSKVKEWLDEGYEISNVTRGHGICWVYILTKKQILPWITGITLKIPVDLERKRAQGEAINFELNLTSLSEEQRDEALKIALSDPEVKKYIGDFEFEVEGVEVSAYQFCYKGCYPYAYPTVFIKLNPDPRSYSYDYRVFVDLEKKEVVDIHSFYRKPSPIYLNNSTVGADEG